MKTIAALALLAVGASAQDPQAEEDPAKKIADLVRQLGHDEYAAREKASQELRKIGKPAEEALRKATSSEDPEVRARARALLDDLAQAEKPKAEAPRRAPQPNLPGFRGGFGARGSSVQVTSVNGDSTYKIAPGDGSPGITLVKGRAGGVKLEYTDEKGATKSAEAESLEKFLKDHKELAETYGITEEGIDYGGARVSFKGGAFGGVPALPRVFRFRQGFPFQEEEEGRAGGASFEKPSDALRAQLEIPAGQGLVVSRVEEGSDAAALGLRKSDVLLEIDGKKVGSVQDARDGLRKAASIVVLRKGKRETLSPAPPRKDF
jgi:hypothetical protein